MRGGEDFCYETGIGLALEANVSPSKAGLCNEQFVTPGLVPASISDRICG